MVRLGLFARLHAKPSMAAQLAGLLTQAVNLANEEDQTTVWYAVQFDAFTTEAGRNAHLNGQMAAALMANAERLLEQTPTIEKVTILASKYNWMCQAQTNSIFARTYYGALMQTTFRSEVSSSRLKSIYRIRKAADIA